MSFENCQTSNLLFLQHISESINPGSQLDAKIILWAENEIFSQHCVHCRTQSYVITLTPCIHDDVARIVQALWWLTYTTVFFVSFLSVTFIAYYFGLVSHEAVDFLFSIIFYNIDRTLLALWLVKNLCFNTVYSPHYFSVTRQMKQALAVCYTVIKHSVHLRTLEKCRKHEPKTIVFYISQILVVFYNSAIHGLGFFICQISITKVLMQDLVDYHH